MLFWLIIAGLVVLLVAVSQTARDVFGLLWWLRVPILILVLVLWLMWELKVPVIILGLILLVSAWKR